MWPQKHREDVLSILLENFSLCAECVLNIEDTIELEFHSLLIQSLELRGGKNGVHLDG